MQREAPPTIVTQDALDRALMESLRRLSSSESARSAAAAWLRAFDATLAAGKPAPAAYAAANVAWQEAVAGQ